MEAEKDKRMSKNKTHKMKAKIIILLLATLFWNSCAKEDIATSSSIDEALQPYFDTFVTEAIARGELIDLDDYYLQAFIENIEGTDVVGQCSYSENSPRTVRIDRFYWRRATHLQKEFVVFHELGHCLLGRSHTDEENPSGTCISIMESGLGNCNSNYNTATRSSYLDELFQQ